MQEILVFSGTSEGRILAEILSSNSIRVTVCVATEYGQEVMKDSSFTEVRVGRLNQEEIADVIKEKDWLAVVDATHPYAKEVTENIRAACESQNRNVLRLLRKEYEESKDSTEGQIQYVNTIEEAACYLNQTKGNIFLTTGSKEVSRYVELIQDTNRIYARILPGTKELEKCHQLGLRGKQIICMQGPFSEELNAAMLKETGAEWLVTKETSEAGGYPEKLRGAERAGTKVLVIRRPEENGYSMEEILKRLGVSAKGADRKKEIALIGIGMGNPGTLTLEACECIKEAQLLIGAERMINSLPQELQRGKETFISYKTPEIISYIQNHNAYDKIAFLLSGDIGFYSGARQMTEQIKTLGLDYRIKMVCGISSVVYFASRLGMAWEDMKLMSLHGKQQNIIGAVQQNQKVFTLTSGAESIRELSQSFLRYGMTDIHMYLGRNLGSSTEEIEKGEPEDFTEYEKDGLCVAVLVNEKAGKTVVSHGLEDEAFLRDKVPMTKAEVRSISLSKLKLCRNSVIYDIGAGTGSVSVECARLAADGCVYAIEKKPETCALIERNKYKMAVSNLKVVQGEAPEVCGNLPAPTHAFIGGSSGKLEEILKTLWEKNPRVRVVVNAISLETMAEASRLIKKYEFSEKEILQVSTAKSKEIGNYQMMMGQNPVYIITLQS